MLKRLFNLEMMGSVDRLSFLDDERSYGNIIAYNKFTKPDDPEKFLHTVSKRSRYFPRLKSRIVKFMGETMFQMMDDDEYMENVEKHIERCSGVHDLD